MTSALAFMPGIIKGNALHTIARQGGAKKLVVVQLSGGNDGLNMAIPYRNDIYYSLRPKIAIESNTILKLTDEIGLNPELGGIHALFSEGKGCLLNNVGYPNPDHSHFRSMDIWQSASGSDKYLQSGWIGRYLDEVCETNCHSYNALEVDDTLSLALKGERVKGLAVKQPDQFFNAAGNKFLANLHAADHQAKNEALEYLYRTLSETESSIGYLKQQNKKSYTSTDYPQGEFANKLKKIAQFIAADSDIMVYYVSLTGFDTHVNQIVRQNKLLGELSDGIAAFMKDLKSSGKSEDVLVMTFSEFGRRVKQNASGGTDHGTANNIMLFSGDLKKPGVFNEVPNLESLAEGDLQYSLDFRSVYATILRKWLHADDRMILGSTFDMLSFV